ncbi:glycosyltransferase [Allocoprobacillus halotolerans]|uniref:Glycosyltransferase n=1 Tax=Allocoprobacillus halotolerans TaxID=2944914 RepID=A0ABY5HYI2_9FIRM|nr:glycosyltransferase [Allocoprobacillus halotolerans]
MNQDINNYEILLINDSSPDNSQTIIDEYVKKYPNIVKGYIKENGGLGDTRNYAIPYAKGQYLMFVDSDDYIKEYSLKKLISLMKEKDLDILVFDFIKVYDDKKFIHEKSMNDISLTDYILSTPNACNKIFKRLLFLDNNIMFPTRIWYEDLAIIPSLAQYTNKIGYINEGIYFYQFRNNSIMNQNKYNPKILDMIDAIDNLRKHFNNCFLEELEYLSLQHLFYGSALKLLPLKRYKELDKCLCNHKKFYDHWNQNKYYLAKPKLYKLFCYLLSKRKFTLARWLLFFKDYLLKRS